MLRCILGLFGTLGNKNLPLWRRAESKGVFEPKKPPPPPVWIKFKGRLPRFQLSPSKWWTIRMEVLFVMISPGPSETNKWYVNQPDIKNPPLARVINLDKLITPLWILEKKRHFRRFSIKYPDLDFKQEAHPKPPLYHQNEPKKIWPTQLTRTKPRRSLYNWSETPGHILSSHFARDQWISGG